MLGLCWFRDSYWFVWPASIVTLFRFGCFYPVVAVLVLSSSVTGSIRFRFRPVNRFGSGGNRAHDIDSGDAVKVDEKKVIFL